MVQIYAGYFFLFYLHIIFYSFIFVAYLGHVVRFIVHNICSIS